MAVAAAPLWTPRAAAALLGLLPSCRTFCGPDFILLALVCLKHKTLDMVALLRLSLLFLASADGHRGTDRYLELARPVVPAAPLHQELEGNGGAPRLAACRRCLPALASSCRASRLPHLRRGYDGRCSGREEASDAGADGGLLHHCGVLRLEVLVGLRLHHWPLQRNLVLIVVFLAGSHCLVPHVAIAMTMLSVLHLNVAACLCPLLLPAPATDLAVIHPTAVALVPVALVASAVTALLVAGAFLPARARGFPSSSPLAAELHGPESLGGGLHRNAALHAWPQLAE
mmetsp:Transcript_9804/g.28040  ORF Transcript_9804/g.28040 Transcript_9804/m.28040 type:complete len:286 (+) Transcript_9804:5578-6435(+)